MTRVVGVKFKNVSKIYYFDPMSFEIHYDDRVIVETARGIEYGQVVIAPMEFPDERVPQPLKPILRMATADDREGAGGLLDLQEQDRRAGARHEADQGGVHI